MIELISYSPSTDAYITLEHNQLFITSHADKRPLKLSTAESIANAAIRAGFIYPAGRLQFSKPTDLHDYLDQAALRWLKENA